MGDENRGQGGRPRRSRQRRRGGRKEHARPGPVVPEPTSVTRAPTPAPLTPAEVAEMKEHLAYLRAYREPLRLKLNAQEDLLVNGQREPTDRGVVKHLLGKLDRTMVEQAVAREPLRSNAAARARMLAGAIRVTGDLAVVLAWLEALAQLPAKSDAAAAFAEVVRRIEFAHLAPSKLARLLQVLVDTFAGHERVQVLFSLLALPDFREAFDAAERTFPDPVAQACAPLRAVHRRLVGEARADAAEAARLATGVELILTAPDAVLARYTEPMREVLLDLALGPAVPEPLADRAVDVILPTLPRTGPAHARLAIRRAGQLLRRHADDRARALFERLRRSQPGQHAAERWLAALDAPRFGRVAREAEPAAGTRLAPGLWLDAQRPVWVRVAASTEIERLAAEAAIQETLALPGIAPVVEHGIAGDLPYVAVSAAGRPLVTGGALDAPAAVVVLAAIGRLLRALALAGVRLPDAGLGRVVRHPQAGHLVLADLDGARRAPAVEAEHAAATAVAALARTLLPRGVAGLVPPEEAAGVDRALAEPGDLAALVARLDRITLSGTSPGR